MDFHRTLRTLGLSAFLLSAYPPSVLAQDCNCAPVAEAGSDLPFSASYNIGLSPGSFTFSYNTYTQQDEIIVTNGGVTLYDTGCVGASGTLTLAYSGPSVIDVQVIPNCLGGSGTAWDYSLNWCAFYSPPTCTPTVTPTLTASPTFTQTFTPVIPTATATATSTISLTPTRTLTSTRTATLTPTATSTRTLTPTRTITPTVTETPTLFVPTLPSGSPVDPCNFFIVAKNLFRPPEGPLSILVGQCTYPGEYSLKIYNTAGEQVRWLDQGNLTGFWNKAYTWDGRNQRGEDCASGVYLIRLVGPEATKVLKVLLVR